jgi:phage terminase small subunit
MKKNTESQKKKLNARQQFFVNFYLSGMSATEAYTRAGYEAKSAGQNSLNLIKNPYISEIIENRKAEISKNVDNKIALAEEEAFLGILTIGRTGENDFAKLKAWQDILDRRRGKARQTIDNNVDMDIKSEQFNIVIKPASSLLDAIPMDNAPVEDGQNEIIQKK